MVIVEGGKAWAYLPSGHYVGALPAEHLNNMYADYIQHHPSEHHSQAFQDTVVQVIHQLHHRYRVHEPKDAALPTTLRPPPTVLHHLAAVFTLSTQWHSDPLTREQSVRHYTCDIKACHAMH